MIDYLAQHLWQTWAVVAVACLILELTAGDFFIICFSIGAAFAARHGSFGRWHLSPAGRLCRVHTHQPLLGAPLRQALSAKGRGQQGEQCRCADGAPGQGGGGD